jgi:hypothetical protein
LKSEIRNQKSERTLQADFGRNFLSAFRFPLSGSLVVLILVVTLLPAQKLTPVAPLPTTLAVKDSALVAKGEGAVVKPRVNRADTAKVVMHSFDHRKQLITGGAIMATMVTIMVVMNNYNPQVPQ